MNARDAVIGAAYCGFDPERFDPLKMAVAAVDAYRDEVLREAAEKIRSYFNGSLIDDIRAQDADLIDPDKEN